MRLGGKGRYALLALCWGWGCEKPAPPPDAGIPTPVGIRVPLPEGWEAQLGPDQSLLAGPRGRTLLRVDIRPGAGGELPTPEELRSGFAAGLKGESLKLEESQSEADYSSVRLRLQRDASAVEVFLGARRVGKDLFLCASQPGATSSELVGVEKACRTLALGNPPR